MHNDCTLKEFIQGEERCLKFINQDLTFLQDSHIPSTFTNVSHTLTSLTDDLNDIDQMTNYKSMKNIRDELCKDTPQKTEIISPI